MSVCRQICRKALRGCLRVPGCKPICYRCLRPVCYGVSDSEDEDNDSDKEDGHFFSNAHHVQGSEFQEEVPLREQAATETSAVVEYYNDISFLTPPPWHIEKSVVKDEHRGYTNVLSADDMRALPSISNVEYTMCVSDDRHISPAHDYVNMTGERGSGVAGCDLDVPTDSSHHYHNIDRVQMTSETGVTRSHLDSLLNHNQGSQVKARDRCLDLVNSNEQDCDGNYKSVDSVAAPTVHVCYKESTEKTDSVCLPLSETPRVVLDLAESGLCGDHGVIGACNLSDREKNLADSGLCGDHGGIGACHFSEREWVSGKIVNSLGTDIIDDESAKNSEALVILDGTDDTNCESAIAAADRSNELSESGEVNVCCYVTGW
ncbi:uncharacterized protein LOC117323790 [Pecten maximus]|uniref:uncharacterized protein LOC117323790 n=1 Tax=Pecten maximus TaxID=6579 RepID=UPI00145849B8|nr:uncharacterized protein LOC117323790 [Pecten maximus]XP_033735143.1 uncharacterized protein LOC117323790 [Pecten maximus]